MSLPFDNELQRELARVRRQREGGQHTDLSARMDTPTLSPAGVGSPTAPPPLQDLSSMTKMVTELTRPVDRAQLDQEIANFNLTYPVNVDDALNAFWELGIVFYICVKKWCALMFRDGRQFGLHKI